MAKTISEMIYAILGVLVIETLLWALVVIVRQWAELRWLNHKHDSLIDSYEALYDQLLQAKWDQTRPTQALGYGVKSDDPADWWK